MKNFTITFGAILLTLALSAIAFGGSNSNLNSANFWSVEQNQTVFETNTTEIPYFVIEENFRWWQPSRPVPVIASYEMQDVAWTNGSVIFYNPQISSQVPLKVRAFILAHEYGHIYQQTGNENASDAFAARAYSQTDKSVCQAAVWWMINFPNNGDATHPPSRVRARNVARVCGV